MSLARRASERASEQTMGQQYLVESPRTRSPGLPAPPHAKPTRDISNIPPGQDLGLLGALRGRHRHLLLGRKRRASLPLRKKRSPLRWRAHAKSVRQAPAQQHPALHEAARSRTHFPPDAMRSTTEHTGPGLLESCSEMMISRSAADGSASSQWSVGVSEGRRASSWERQQRAKEEEVRTGG